MYETFKSCSYLVCPAEEAATAEMKSDPTKNET